MCTRWTETGKRRNPLESFSLQVSKGLPFGIPMASSPSRQCMRRYQVESFRICALLTVTLVAIHLRVSDFLPFTLRTSPPTIAGRPWLLPKRLKTWEYSCLLPRSPIQWGCRNMIPVPANAGTIGIVSSFTGPRGEKCKWPHPQCLPMAELSAARWCDLTMHQYKESCVISFSFFFALLLCTSAIVLFSFIAVMY